MLLVQIDIDVHDPDCLPRIHMKAWSLVSTRIRRLFFESAILTGQHIESWSSVRVIYDVSQLLKVGKNYFQVGMVCCKPQLQEVRI